MGNMAYRALALSQQDVEELRMEHCRGRLSQTEVEALFARFRDLDRDHKVSRASSYPAERARRGRTSRPPWGCWSAASMPFFRRT